MGLSLEGFGGEFEIRKIAFELEDLKKGREIEERKVDLFLADLVWEADANIYMWEKEKKRARIRGFFFREGDTEKDKGFWGRRLFLLERKFTYKGDLF